MGALDRDRLFHARRAVAVASGQVEVDEAKDLSFRRRYRGALSPQVDYWPHEVRKGQDPQSWARRTKEHELCASALAVPPGDK